MTVQTPTPTIREQYESAGDLEALGSLEDYHAKLAATALLDGDLDAARDNAERFREARDAAGRVIARRAGDIATLAAHKPVESLGGMPVSGDDLARAIREGAA